MREGQTAVMVVQTADARSVHPRRAGAAVEQRGVQKSWPSIEQ